MALDAGQLRTHIVRPALKRVDLWSHDAEELLMGTIAQESHMGTYRRQLGNGPALGICQMEPPTHDDCWTNYLAYHRPLAEKILRLVYGDDYNEDTVVVPHAELMVEDDAYAVVMARIKYLRAPKRLPSADDVLSMANYWKKYYNTPLGKGTVEEFLRNYVERVAE